MDTVRPAMRSFSDEARNGEATEQHLAVGKVKRVIGKRLLN